MTVLGATPPARLHKYHSQPLTQCVHTKLYVFSVFSHTEVSSIRG